MVYVFPQGGYGLRGRLRGPQDKSTMMQPSASSEIFLVYYWTIPKESELPVMSVAYESLLNSQSGQPYS